MVETPRGSRTKFAYDAEIGMFRAKKLLAMGFAFPFPFGFLPSTRAHDGDPLDVLLLTDAELPMGSLVRCRLLGAIGVEETSEGITKRNDRLLAVPLLLHQDRPPYELADMPSAELKDIEDFFVAYQAADGKETKILGRFERSDAERLVREAFHALRKLDEGFALRDVGLKISVRGSLPAVSWNSTSARTLKRIIELAQNRSA